MNEWLWILGGIYVLVLIYLTTRAWRRTKGTDDYLLAGSSVGATLGFLTFAATLFSAFTLMGMPDFFREHGVGAWVFLAVSDGAMVFVILWFGYHVRRRAADKGYKGIAGLLSDIYGSRWAGAVYFTGAFLFLIPYVAVQIRGIGIFLDASFPGIMPVWAWATVMVVALVVYSEIGGLKAIMYSDVLQGLLLLFLTWIIAAACVDSLGGIEAMFVEVERVNPELLSVPGPQGLFSLQFLIASFLAITLLPVTQPQLTTRIVIMRDFRRMKTMAVAVGVFAILVILPTIAIGMYGAVHYADVPTAEFLANALVFDQPILVGSAVAIGLIAAAMSTADSQIFALGGELRSMLRGTDSSVLYRTKGAILLFALGALVFAIQSTDELVMLARVSFAGTSLLAPMILVGILAARPPKLAMIGSMTCLSLTIFILSLAGVLPGEIRGIRMDLFLLIGTGLMATLLTVLQPRTSEADVVSVS